VKYWAGAALEVDALHPHLLIFAALSKWRMASPYLLANYLVALLSLLVMVSVSAFLISSKH
jgi:hypothetical protein